MLADEPFSPKEKWLVLLSALVLLIAFFYNLGIYPLYLEEPRRALIALEMILQENIWVPTQTGDLYLRKPPLYNWLLIFSYRLFGDYSEWATRFFSVVSHLLLALVTYRFAKIYLPRATALLAAGSYLVVVDVLMFFSTIGEIDLFYSLITSSAIFLIFYFGEKKSFLQLFLSVYFLTALGFLTKGLSSLPFAAISLLVYFLSTKQWRLLFSWSHFLGMGLFLLICGGYFYQYGQFEEISGWWEVLVNESVSKTTTNSLWKYLLHLVTYPVEALKNMLPASLLLPVLLKRGGVSTVWRHEFVRYAVLIFTANFLVFWLAADARGRYIYPLFPFGVIGLTYLLPTASPVFTKGLRILIIVILSLLTLASSALFFVEALEVVPHRPLVFFVLMAAVSILGYLAFRGEVRPYLMILALCVAMKLAFSLTVPHMRQHEGGAASDKKLALELAEIAGDRPIHRLGPVRMSLTGAFYLERELQKVLYQKAVLEPGLYLCYPEDIEETPQYTVVYQIDYRGGTILLVEVPSGEQ